LQRSVGFQTEDAVNCLFPKPVEEVLAQLPLLTDRSRWESPPTAKTATAPAAAVPGQEARGETSPTKTVTGVEKKNSDMVGKFRPWE
jgi:hypothetical protein